MKVCLDWGFGTCKRELVQACVCASINQIKQICCVFVWWVAVLKMKACLDCRLGKCKRESVQVLCLHIHKPKRLPRFFFNNHPPTCCHITPDPPAPPWSMLLPNACRHPNRNGCFFEGFSKQSDVTTLNWGEGGMQVSLQWVWQDGCYSENHVSCHMTDDTHIIGEA